MISNFHEVRIKCILNQILRKVECDLKKVMQCPIIYQKIQLSRSLYLSKIIFARFLVLYRWSKFNQNNFIQNNDGFNRYSDLQKLLNETYLYIKENNALYQKNINHSFFSIKQNIFPIVNYPQNSYKTDKIFLQLLCQENVTRIKSFRAFKNYLLFDAHPFYTFILKYRRNACRLYKLKLTFNKKFNLPDDFIKAIIKKVGLIDLNRTDELKRIDSIFYHFFMINSFSTFADQISKNSESFGAKVLRTEDNSIHILFPDCFMPFNCFTMKLLTPSYHIEIYSKVPLFFPPKDPRTIHETFEKLSNETVPKTELYHRILNPIEPFNPNVLLCELRDLIFYTGVRRFWEYTKRSIRSAFFSHFRIELRCEKDSILFIKIICFNHHLLITIEFDPNNGLPIFIPISKYYKIENQSRFPDVARIMTSVFTRYIEHLELSYIFKRHIFYLISPFHLYHFSSFKYTFSFSDHYFVSTHHTTAYPVFNLRRIDNLSINLNPRTLLIKSIANRKFPDEWDGLVNYIFVTSKIFIILSEMERKLNAMGILSKRYVNILYIIPFSCHFKIDYSEYWTLTFEKMPVQFQPKGKTIIRGNRVTLRFIDSIIDIVQNVFRIASMTFQSKDYLEYTNEVETFLKPFGYLYRIALQPIIEDYYDKESASHFVTLVPFRQPKLKCTTLKLTPLSQCVDNTKCYDSFAGYVHTTIFSHMTLYNAFNSDKWKIIPGGKDNSTITLVYKDMMTIILFRLLNHKHYNGYVADHGKSCFLLAPLSNLFTIKEMANSHVAMFEGTIFDAEKIRSEIELYDDYMDVCNTMMIDTFNYKDGKVIGKAVRFYLVQVAIDNRGMIASSPSYPSLSTITTAIYNLDILTFEAKKKIVIFICGIIKLEITPVVIFLNFFKILVSPDWIQKVDWQEMSQDLIINIDKITFQFSIVENGVKLLVIFNDPVNKLVTLSKDDVLKTINYLDFKDRFMNLRLDAPIYTQLFT